MINAYPAIFYKETNALNVLRDVVPVRVHFCALPVFMDTVLMEHSAAKRLALTAG